jgi:hypothetical protein
MGPLIERGNLLIPAKTPAPREHRETLYLEKELDFHMTVSAV